MNEKVEFRCSGCGKLLANTDGNSDIVCSRCGGLNELNIKTNKVVFTSRENRRCASGSDSLTKE